MERKRLSSGRGKSFILYADFPNVDIRLTANKQFSPAYLEHQISAILFYLCEMNIRDKFYFIHFWFHKISFHCSCQTLSL